MATPFDDLFRFTFGHAHLLAAWLQAILPAAVRDVIQWDQVGAAAETMQGDDGRLQPDGLFMARLVDHTAFWILDEHKSHVDPKVRWQMLRYAVALADRAPEDGTAKPVLVLPVLLHHASAPYAPSETRNLPPELLALQPQLQIVVDDISQMTEARMLAQNLPPLATVTRLCLRFVRDLSAEAAIELLQRWSSYLRAVDRAPHAPGGEAAIRAIARYVLMVTEVPPRRLHELFEHILQRTEHTIMSTGEKLIQQGLERGRVEGRVEGRVQGAIETLQRLLRRRFGELPASALERLRRAGIDELEQFAERLLDAPSIDDVFAS